MAMKAVIVKNGEIKSRNSLASKLLECSIKTIKAIKIRFNIKVEMKSPFALNEEKMRFFLFRSTSRKTTDTRRNTQLTRKSPMKKMSAAKP